MKSKRKYRKHGDERRSKRIEIRLSPQEHNEIKEQALENGLSVGAYLIGLALGFEE